MFFGATYVEKNTKVLVISSRYFWKKIGFAKLSGRSGSVELRDYSHWEFNHKRDSKKLVVESYNKTNHLKISCHFKFLRQPELVVETMNIGSFSMKLRKKIKIDVDGHSYCMYTSNPISSNPIFVIRQILCLGILNFDPVIVGCDARKAPEELIITAILIRFLIFPDDYDG